MDKTTIKLNGDVDLTYIPSISDYVKGVSDVMFDELKKLDWVHHDKVPRHEYYAARNRMPYAYGKVPRTYLSQPITPALEFAWDAAETLCECKFDVVFLNYYLDGHDHLGWHSDDSDEMDDARPIAIITYGAEREIWFRKEDDDIVTKLMLEHGSLCVMPAGMQDTHKHRIPKSSVHNCGPRISLTFRGFVQL